MAKLFEYKGKEILKAEGINVPRGKVFDRNLFIDKSVEEFVKGIGCEVVIKAQVFSTERASAGGIKFESCPESAKITVKKMFDELFLKGEKVEKILVEEKIKISKEYYAGIIIDDTLKMPVLIISSKGGTGIEQIAKEYPELVIKKNINIIDWLKREEILQMLTEVKITGNEKHNFADAIIKLLSLAKKLEVRSIEVNPFGVRDDGTLYALDCRVTIDDHALFRHPEVGIEIAREFCRPPTLIEKIAWNVEKNDYRGTFYFIQLEKDFKKGEKFVGFHGSGGGGAMMSMDALIRAGFKPANFCDTSGNPPASKVYRAARIILSQKNIDGYFGSGSGVASQEQFHSARGLVKAFREVGIDVPVVMRLGGNQEEKAIEILTKWTSDLNVPIECYGKDTTPEHCAQRFALLISSFKSNKIEAKKHSEPLKPYKFKTLTGGVIFDHSICKKCKSKICIQACVPNILKLENDLPVLSISEEEAEKGRCTECLACEVDCFVKGSGGGYVHLPIQGLEEV